MSANPSLPVMEVDKAPLPRDGFKINQNVRRPRRSRGRGTFGKPNDRTSTWRSNVNNKVVAQADADREARFKNYGLQDPSSAAKPPTNLTDFQDINTVQFLGMASSPRAHPVPISTQGLGFIVNQYYLKLVETLGADKITRVCTLNQLYRYSLAQLSYHLYRLRTEVVPRYSYVTEIPGVPIVEFDVLEALKSCELNAGFITSYIQRIGVVTSFDVPHVPILMTEDIRSPLYLSIFTLRQTLLTLRGRGNDAYQDHFVAHNPVPGLEVGLPLNNVDIIIPANYGRDMIYRDASAVRALMNYVAAKLRDIPLNTGRLGILGEGNPGILLSSTLTNDTDENVRIPLVRPPDLYRSIIGTVDTFWSQPALTDDQRRLGVLGLYVRADAGGVDVPTGNRWLSAETAHHIVSADYSAYVQRLIT